MNINILSTIMCTNAITSLPTRVQIQKEVSRNVEPVLKTTYDKDKEEHKKGNNK